MGQIDLMGTYRGTVTESGVGLTKTGKPQWIARLLATAKWVDDAEGMAFYKLAEPSWVDWSAMKEDAVAFLLLFNDTEQFTKENAMLNYEQLQLALGWDGTEFDSLGDHTHIGKEILFRIAEEEYNGKTSAKVGWIDSKDADPVRQLRTLGADEIKSLAAKLKIGKAPPKPAKPATAAAPATAKPPTKPPTPAAAAPATVAAPAAATPSPTPPAASTPKPPKGKKTPAPAPAPAAEPAVESSEALPVEVTQMQAYEFLMKNKGGNVDGAIDEAWLAACQEVDGKFTLGGEENFKDSHWAAVRDIVIKDLALEVK